MSTKPKPTRANRYTVPVASPQLLRDVCGPAHSHLQLVEQAFADDGVRVDSQGGEIVVTGNGEGAKQAADALQAFARRIAGGAEATSAELEAAIKLTVSDGLAAASGDAIAGLRKPIMAQTPGQRSYLEKLRRDDLGKLVPGAKAPKLVTNDTVAQMKSGSVLVDIAIDQGGCFEDSRPTTHDDPTFTVHDSVFYCVANMPGSVPRTSTFALTNATMPYVLKLADRGWKAACAADPALAKGLSTHDGALLSQQVADDLGLPFTDPAPLFA